MKEDHQNGNYVSVGLDGIEVHSHKASLQEVEECVGRLIKKHRRFITYKFKSRRGGSGYG